MRRLLLAAVLVLGGCAGQAIAPGGTTLTPTGTAATDATADSDESTPPPGTERVKLGQTVPIECNGDPCLDVVVLQAKFAGRYKDPDGYYDDTPEHKGDVFLAVQVRYTATGPNATYNMFDWALYVNDEQVQNTASVLNGPKPELSSGDLPKGKKAQGWITWEVPKSGRVVLSYEPGPNGSIFELVTRPK